MTKSVSALLFCRWIGLHVWIWSELNNKEYDSPVWQGLCAHLVHFVVSSLAEGTQNTVNKSAVSEHGGTPAAIGDSNKNITGTDVLVGGM